MNQKKEEKKVWKSFKSREEKRKILGYCVVIHVDKDESKERRKENVWKSLKSREEKRKILGYKDESKERIEKKSVKKFNI